MKYYRDLSKKKKMIKNMNSKNDSKLTVINNHTYNQNKRKLSQQLEQEQNHRNRDHMEGYQQEGGRRRMGENVQEIRCINGRYKMDRGRLRIV